MHFTEYLLKFFALTQLNAYRIVPAEISSARQDQISETGQSGKRSWIGAQVKSQPTDLCHSSGNKCSPGIQAHTESIKDPGCNGNYIFNRTTQFNADEVIAGIHPEIRCCKYVLNPGGNLVIAARYRYRRGNFLSDFFGKTGAGNHRQPISIDFGESAVATGEVGLVEMNVGDTTYDVNDPTANVNSYTVSSVSGINVATSAAAEAAIDALDAALETVNGYRGDLGAIQNRLNHTVSNLANVVENTSASQSRILDADFAVEAAALARAQILQQAGTAMLAQANAAPQNVLSLLG